MRLSRFRRVILNQDHLHHVMMLLVGVASLVWLDAERSPCLLLATRENAREDILAFAQDAARPLHESQTWKDTSLVFIVKVTLTQTGVHSAGRRSLVKMPCLDMRMIAVQCAHVRKPLPQLNVGLEKHAKPTLHPVPSNIPSFLNTETPLYL